VEQRLRLSVLGIIPRLKKQEVPAQALRDLRSAFSEAYRSVRTALQFSTDSGVPRVLLVTSPGPAEGKSTTAWSLARNFAQLGKRTLLIDGDLRNPGLTRALPVVPEKGIVEALMGGDQRWQNTILVDRKTRLAILPAVVRGRLSHTSELISGPGMRDLIEAARQSFDYIIVDLPPLGPVVDAKAFAPLADGFVMAVEWGATPRALVRSALQAEPQIAAKLLGLVLNKTDFKQLPRYGLFGGAEQYFDRYTSYYIEQPSMAGKTASRMEPV
jgi:succinoglycan biosynthesis transport protein ExoP